MTADKGSEFVRVRRDALQRARDTAMEWTVRGRIPECGEFGGIAQDLDAMLSAAPAPQPVHSCLNCLGVDPDSCALDRSPQPVQGEAVQIAAPDHIADARKMVAAPGDVEERARELLDAECIKRAPRSSALVSVSTALRAITAALRSQPVAAPGDVEREVQMLRELLADADHALAELGACDIPDCDEPNCLKVRQRIAAIAP